MLTDFQTVKTLNATVYHGSNLDVLPFMADNSVDAIVTDPPYELGFMGKKWDNTGIAYSVELWTECLRVLKPGGHILAFGGSRTWHRMAVAIEDAGFELRDSIAWLYGSGFPKSHNVALGIDKHFGHANRGKAIPVASTYQASDVDEVNKLMSNPVEEYEAKTDEAQKWAGWGTALKPAFEPVVVGRKPLSGTIAENVLEWGVGGLNIDASRIGTEQRVNQPAANKPGGSSYNLSVNGMPDDAKSSTVTGRWPANVIFDEYTAALLDEQSGHSKSTGIINRWTNGAKPFGNGAGNPYESIQGIADEGGASRFFYVSKANKTDRNEGLENLEAKTAAEMTGRKEGSAGLVMKHADGSDKANAYAGTTGSPRQNFHPTVKPTDLMRHLIKLVTPPGGIVLDPFTGSGSTGKAAILDGFQFQGIELTDDYLPIIQGRLEWAEQELIKANIKEQEKLF
jgi:site-specific DNA-methyltransferase (adenine-specific)